MIYKTLLIKLEMEQREPHYKPRMNYGSMDVIGWSSSSCFTGDTGRFTVKRHVHPLIWKSCWTPVYVSKYK